MRATRGDALVLVATAVATIVFDLVTAVIVGLVIAGLYALRQMAKSARVEELDLGTGDHTSEEQALLDQHVVAYRLDGPLFFGAAHRFLVEVSEVSDVRVVILRLSRIQTLDATGASVLGETIRTLEGRRITVLLSGIQPTHEEVFRVLGVYDELAHEKHVFATTPEAIAHAREHLAKTSHHGSPAA
jgi:SulP family sulfate permease